MTLASNCPVTLGAGAVKLEALIPAAAPNERTPPTDARGASDEYDRPTAGKDCVFAIAPKAPIVQKEPGADGIYRMRLGPGEGPARGRLCQMWGARSRSRFHRLLRRRHEAGRTSTPWTTTHSRRRSASDRNRRATIPVSAFATAGHNALD